MRQKILIAAGAAMAMTLGAAKAETNDSVWPEGMPKPTASYEGAYQMTANGETESITINSADGKQRMTFPAGSNLAGKKSKFARVAVIEPDAGSMLMWPEGKGAPKIAMTMNRADATNMAAAFGVDDAARVTAKKTGADKVLGIDCAVYELKTIGGSSTTCVTRDGMVLRSKDSSGSTMEATSIKRGPQAASLFAPPTDYEVADMGECMRLAADMMAAARAGKQPDMAKMQKCQELGEKMKGFDQ